MLSQVLPILEIKLCLIRHIKQHITVRLDSW